MRLRLAITSGFIFAIIWPRLQNPAARSYVRFPHRSGLIAPTLAPQSICPTMSFLSYALLQQQSADTSNALMNHWLDSTDFQKLAEYEGNMTVARDNEDAKKLQIGIDYAKQKGVIDPNFVPDPYVKIDVLGKTPAQVADEIIATVQKGQSQGGSVIVLCGLSGTGKVRPDFEHLLSLKMSFFSCSWFPHSFYSGNDGGNLATKVGTRRGQTGRYLVQWQHF